MVSDAALSHASLFLKECLVSARIRGGQGNKAVNKGAPNILLIMTDDTGPMGRTGSFDRVFRHGVHACLASECQERTAPQIH